MDVAVAFGRVLKRLRKAAGLTQEELAFASSLQRVYISALERSIKQPSLATVFSLSAALGVEPGRFVTLVAEETENQSGHEVGHRHQ